MIHVLEIVAFPYCQFTFSEYVFKLVMAASVAFRKLARLSCRDLSQKPGFLGCIPTSVDHFRSSSETVHHTWPPSNQLADLILSLIRENLASKTQNDISSHDIRQTTESGFLLSNATSNGAVNRGPFPVIVDMTFGNGIHSRAILEECSQERDLTLFAMDRDPKAVELAEELSREESRTVVPLQAK